MMSTESLSVDSISQYVYLLQNLVILKVISQMKKLRSLWAPVNWFIVYKWWNCPKVKRDKYNGFNGHVAISMHVCKVCVWAGISKTQTEEQTDACWNRSIQMLDRSKAVLIPREHECSVTGKPQRLQTHTHTCSQVAQLMGQVQATSHKPKHDLNSTSTERQCIYILMRTCCLIFSILIFHLTDKGREV